MDNEQLAQTDLNEEQHRALELMIRGDNLFITGLAGSGKSTLIEAFKKHSPRNTVFLGPTGTSANNIGGCTVHSFFGLRAQFFGPNFRASLSVDAWDRIAMVEAVVIDEISMVRADLLSALAAVLRQTAENDDQYEVFGGRQIIVAGCFFQLEPVVTSGQEFNLLQRFHGGRFAFQTAEWEAAQFENIILRTPHRQAEDPEFLEILNTIRCGGNNATGMTLVEAVERLNARIADNPRRLEDRTSLCSNNDLATAINSARDAENGGTPRTFTGKVAGDFPQENLPTEPFLQLRPGSRVMLLANCPHPDGGYWYVNGTMGKVVDFDGDSVCPRIGVVRDDGRYVKVGFNRWFNQRYDVVINPWTGLEEVQEQIIGTYDQLAVMLGYAITVHKAQGLTLDSVNIELGRGTFASGQLYTALSRCRSMNDVSIDRPLHLGDVIVDPAIRDFYAGIEDFSELCYDSKMIF